MVRLVWPFCRRVDPLGGASYRCTWARRPAEGADERGPSLATKRRPPPPWSVGFGFGTFCTYTTNRFRPISHTSIMLLVLVFLFSLL